eukprot:TRINITY_DN11175_c0_g3_i1.p2 TRINITY_DN11175_c0_g3~~TRINITY_DN11175_c0_g3_i1.p2  ORF type:complete len:178 (+),score=58.07 TRINITY_DN11175_c0_g3_i1:42-575(+)
MRNIFFFFFKQKTAYEMLRSLVGSEMCIRDRERFAEWSGSLMLRTGMSSVNQIGTAYRTEDVQETAAQGVDMVLFDDYYLKSNLTGRVREVNRTLVTARRFALSKTFGVRVNPDQLVAGLNAGSVDYKSEQGYSVVGVEVWSYGVTDLKDVAARLEASRVRVVSAQEYAACLRQHVL